jgi:integrase
VGSKESKTQQDGVLAKPRTLMSLSAISRNPLRERAQNLTGYGLKLLALTFVRPGTVQKAEWANFDLKAGLWVVPFKQLKMASQRKKAGASESDHIVPLSR